MKIKKGDTVLIISGKDKNKKGKILRVFPKEEKVLVEGANLRKKHQKPKKSGEKGQTISLPAPIHVSNMKFFCSKCGKASRLGYKITSDKNPDAKGSGLRPPTFQSERRRKYRICKKCKEII